MAILLLDSVGGGLSAQAILTVPTAQLFFH
jgi:hypothetical protein